MKLRSKIISVVVFAYLMGIVTSVFGLYYIEKLCDSSRQQLIIQNATSAFDDVKMAHYAWRSDLTQSLITGEQFKGSLDPNSCALGKWLESDLKINTSTPEINAIYEKLKTPHDHIHESAKEINDLLSRGEKNEAEQLFVNSIYPSISDTFDCLNEISEKYYITLESENSRTSEIESGAFITIFIIIIITTIIETIVVIIVIKSVMNPLRKIANVAENIASGDLQSHFQYNINDEIGTLSKNFEKISDTFSSMITDLSYMSEQQNQGVIDSYIDSDKYSGSYKNVINQVNSMVKDYVDQTSEILRVIRAYAEGDFSARAFPFPGMKSATNRTLESVAGNLKNVKLSVLELVEAAMNGELDKRVDNSKYKGEWAEIINGMNDLLYMIDTPLEESANALIEMSKGNLKMSIDGDYKGKFAVVKDSLNTTIATMSSYVGEINDVLKEISRGNLLVSIDREYVGQFSTIKESINLIVTSLHKIILDINVASEQMLHGSSQISTSSMALADGAQTQAISVDGLTSSIDIIDSQIKSNVKRSLKANALSKRSMDNSKKGNEEMVLMMEAINGIEVASNNISNIIKVIEDISFQTNLLALNAAVEAARAGEHGKGFSVVAEEVRNLATKSSNAAQETTQLIENSIEKVRNGINIAHTTSKALEKIIEDVNSVSELISEVAKSSQDQASAITDMSIELKQVSEVILSNSSTSEETAASSEELNSQASVLKGMVDYFKV